MVAFNSKISLSLLLAFIISGCGGSDSDTPQALPEVNTSGDVLVIEGNNIITTGTMPFLVELSAPTDDYVYVAGRITGVNATGGDDWSLGFYTATFMGEWPLPVFPDCPIRIYPGHTSGGCWVQIVQDNVYEPNETLMLSLTQVSTNAKLGANISSVGTILNDDYGGINDTNVSTCSDANTNSISCSAAQIITSFPDQDAHHGYTSMSYTKLDSNGADTVNPADWSCVRDNGAGLVWEAKQLDGLHNSGDTFSWFDSDAATNGGNAGVASLGNCNQARRCDTEKFVADVNAAGLCGFNDWRVPTADELRSLVDYASLTINSPALDATYFDPSSPPPDYWTADTISGAPANAWMIEFVDGSGQAIQKDNTFAVRLVRP